LALLLRSRRGAIVLSSGSVRLQPNYSFNATVMCRADNPASLSGALTQALGHSMRLAVLLSFLITAACSRAVVNSEPIDPPCLPGTRSCTPEEAATLTSSEIPTVGPSITVSCGVAAADDKPAARTRCTERTRQMLKRLSHVLPAIDSSTHIELNEARICLDTFTPGREAADCEFFEISARVALRPHH